jgi:hypothetical protein
MVESILLVPDINVNVHTPDQRDNPLTATITYNSLECLKLLLKHPDIHVNKILSPCHGTHSLTHYLTHSLTYSLTHSFIHSLTH